MMFVATTSTIDIELNPVFAGCSDRHHWRQASAAYYGGRLWEGAHRVEKVPKAVRGRNEYVRVPRCSLSPLCLVSGPSLVFALSPLFFSAFAFCSGPRPLWRVPRGG